MISRIDGVLESLIDSRAEVRCGDIVYAVLIPGVDQQRLAQRLGEPLTLHTLHYLESNNQGASFTPRLIGFRSSSDRAFFELFTTVKGLGNRKALRALQLPFGRIAEAIAKKDIDLLKSLPEIGKRTAETIIVELAGKVDLFVSAERDASGRADAGGPRKSGAARIADEAVAVLVTLGEPKLQSVQLVQRALDADPEIETAEGLIAAVYRLKSLPV
jgi:Holliday junction DNA helicase RuvA